VGAPYLTALLPGDVGIIALDERVLPSIGAHKNSVQIGMKMRVIAGTYRSRRLSAPRGLATRPTSDRLRETLFNVLAGQIEDAVFADLYAGSGAVGLEALSRGARWVYFVEHAPAAVAAIRENLAALKIASGYKIETSSVAAALRRMMDRSSPARCTIVFMDPPYAGEGDYARTLTSMGEGADSLLTAEGIVVAEHNRLLPLADSYGHLRRYRLIEQGEARLSFFRAAGSED
jgi:16S rRNA (guanine966-N2)-methyltransferase